MTQCKRLTLEEFRKIIPQGTPQDEEIHCSWGAILCWRRGGKTYEEHQFDIGGACKRYVTD